MRCRDQNTKTERKDKRQGKENFQKELSLMPSEGEDVAFMKHEQNVVRRKYLENQGS